ncbi:hypothetical protein HmCmsJML034_04358 [Escherichia coli]|nr:hypothetical protein HmCmsJML034_04358 [Escherichia coli]
MKIVFWGIYLCPMKRVISLAVEAKSDIPDHFPGKCCHFYSLGE